MNPEITQLMAQITTKRRELRELEGNVRLIQESCLHKERGLMSAPLRPDKVICKECGKCLGYKCDNREDSPCSYNLKVPMPHHAACRHGCGRLFEEDCQ